MEDKFFYCKSKRLANYLIKHGSVFIETGEYKGYFAYIFVDDDSINANLDKWKADMKKCLF